MDLSPFKKDVDELLEEFSGQNATTLDELKKIWRSHKFSFIYEAKPFATDSAFLMQALYAHATSHMVFGDSLSQRLGAIYCLYCLYETQPFKPAFKIYLSLGELKKLRVLVQDAERNGVADVPALVRRMLSKNMFLFGFVDNNEDSMSERIAELTELQNVQMRVAYDKLFSKTQFKEYVHMDMAAALDLEELKKISKQYAREKEIAIDAAGKTLPVEDIKHIGDANLVGDEVEKIAGFWEMQKQQLYQKTGIEVPTKDAENNEFGMELENLLAD
ncbi:uncharacterized protein LOC116253080 [Nymphaea colorata]|nr:uncharacterized protein LOC116253080 [Nymphaea colorata]XP_031483684.1 uncharacterized protein LOC116253080 [Nymphaea colorata]XP_031483685.1 uncharacterized protein LOC116253080 [Nymphaea colorata]XP_031483686.1 uncharacterized protein LOC116253080 [Nymphaea colorata]XP_031483687.1 uncharacterized protein LOC116253080 [Nymphaea colorata]XP_031483690.1 uncharacterized protein LOC116253080 [Nymphaea colorata]XP_031483691.1 uncharacterized protein LOC116253080 [Nymphaea colorata]XP_03148369